MSLFDLTGKVAVVTGSTRGIGRAIAERMAEHGAKVVISSRKGDVCETVAQEIRDAVNNVLAAKGFTLATGDKADLNVGYQCSVDREREWSAWGMGGGLRWGGGMASAESSTITNGMLAVDFYDPTSQQLIWRGTAAQTLNPSGNPQKDMERLNKAVNKLLKHFPPGA